jgi:hypothetical protein
MESGNIMELADPELKGKFDPGQMHRVVLTASYCVRQSSPWRPSMSEVNIHYYVLGDALIVHMRWQPTNLIEPISCFLCFLRRC